MLSIDKWLDLYALSIQYHVRIIDRSSKFCQMSECIDVSPLRWNETKGWSKPDIEFEGIEIRYLWKQFKPKCYQ